MVQQQRTEAALMCENRSGGSESGGGNGGSGYARRSSGSDPGAISRRGSGHADAAHYAALEEKVTHAKPCCFLIPHCAVCMGTQMWLGAQGLSLYSC